MVNSMGPYLSFVENVRYSMKKESQITVTTCCWAAIKRLGKGQYYNLCSFIPKWNQTLCKRIEEKQLWTLTLPKSPSALFLVAIIELWITS